MLEARGQDRRRHLLHQEFIWNFHLRESHHWCQFLQIGRKRQENINSKESRTFPNWPAHHRPNILSHRQQIDMLTFLRCLQPLSIVDYIARKPVMGMSTRVNRIHI